MEHQNNSISERDLENVAGGAVVVDISKANAFKAYCFNCKSTNVAVEQNGSYVTVTCRDCGAVDMRKA